MSNSYRELPMLVKGTGNYQNLCQTVTRTGSYLCQTVTRTGIYLCKMIKAYVLYSLSMILYDRLSL